MTPPPERGLPCLELHHLEEAYWFGEGVMPELRKRGALTPQHQREAPLRVSA